MRVIIAGSRAVTDRHLVSQAVVDSSFSVTEVVEGGARGIDTLAFDWAHSHGIPVKIFVANWKKHGKQAGILRNIEMADYAEALIAIWDGKSRGTKHMIDIAEKRRMPYKVFIAKNATEGFTIDELQVLERNQGGPYAEVVPY